MNADSLIPSAVIAGYLVIVGVGAVAEFYAHFRPTRIAPVFEMLEFVMRQRTTRIGIIAAWWWFGWHFLFAPTIQLNV